MTTTAIPDNFFERLGLDPETATDDDVKVAYRKLAAIYFPGGGGKDSDPAWFAAIVEARDKLATQKLRNRYLLSLIENDDAPANLRDGVPIKVDREPDDDDDDEPFTPGATAPQATSWYATPAASQHYAATQSMAGSPGLWKPSGGQLWSRPRVPAINKFGLVFIGLVVLAFCLIIGLNWTGFIDVLHAIGFICHVGVLLVELIFKILNAIGNHFAKHGSQPHH